LGQPLNVGTVEAVLEGDLGVTLALAGQIAAGFFAVKAAIGPGLETVEQAKAREVKALEVKKAKALNAEKFVIETKALKLAKQLGIDLEQAKTVVKAKEEKAKVDKAAEVAAKEKAIIVKLAKALNVTDEQAKAIRLAQLAKKAKK
jgi:predicted nucleotidyltransferase